MKQARSKRGHDMSLCKLIAYRNRTHPSEAGLFSVDLRLIDTDIVATHFVTAAKLDELRGLSTFRRWIVSGPVGCSKPKLDLAGNPLARNRPKPCC